LPKQLVQNILVLGGRRLEPIVEAAMVGRSILSKIFLAQEGNFRKLSYFSDKEGKTRVIGILDYWSQTVLRGLHNYLYRVLKKIPQDMTFDQGAFKDIVTT
jgi:hypothetical protein